MHLAELGIKLRLNTSGVTNDFVSRCCPTANEYILDLVHTGRAVINLYKQRKYSCPLPNLTGSVGGMSCTGNLKALAVKIEVDTLLKGRGM